MISRRNLKKGGISVVGSNHQSPLIHEFTNGNRIQYVYSPDGRKLRATWQTAVANIVVGQGTGRSWGQVIDFMMIRNIKE